MSSPLTWNGALTIALGSSVLSALLNQAVEFCREIRRDHRNASLAGTELALSSVGTLTEFARHCSESIGQSRTDEEYQVFSVKLPPLTINSDKPDGWAHLPPRLAAAIGDLKIQRVQAESLITWTDTMEGRYDAVLACRKCCAELGFRSWSIANAFRKHYGLGRFSGSTEFLIDLVPKRSARYRRLTRCCQDVLKVVKRGPSSPR